MFLISILINGAQFIISKLKDIFLIKKKKKKKLEIGNHRFKYLYILSSWEVGDAFQNKSMIDLYFFYSQGNSD